MLHVIYMRIDSYSQPTELKLMTLNLSTKTFFLMLAAIMVINALRPCSTGACPSGVCIIPSRPELVAPTTTTDKLP